MPKKTLDVPKVMPLKIYFIKYHKNYATENTFHWHSKKMSPKLYFDSFLKVIIGTNFNYHSVFKVFFSFYTKVY